MKELPSFVELVHCVVGEGRDTYSWEDHWVGKKPLCALFPRLFHLLSLKKHFVTTSLCGLGAPVVSFGFSRSLTNRETIEMTSFLSLLEGHSFRRGRRDVRV